MRLAHAGYALAMLVCLTAASPVPAAPQRVVSTFLCTDEYVFRLLPRERIAALSFLAGDSHPVVSTLIGKVDGIRLIHPSAEEIVTLKPDLVVMYAGTNPALHAILQKVGIPVLDVPWANSLTDIRRITALLGDKLGAEDRARALVADMDAALKRVQENAVKPPVRTLIYEPNGYATSSGVSDEIMRASGLRNVATEFHMTRQGTIPVEAVIASAPDVLILNGAIHSLQTRADLIQHHPALNTLRGRTVIATLNLTPLLCPGPWSVDAAFAFAPLGHQARALAMHRTPS
jgi:iron complex transport system substrate-binding protein